MVEMESQSQRRSEPTWVGLERARAIGETLGRPKRSRDEKKCGRSGYFARFAK